MEVRKKQLFEISRIALKRKLKQRIRLRMVYTLPYKKGQIAITQTKEISQEIQKEVYFHPRSLF